MPLSGMSPRVREVYFQRLAEMTPSERLVLARHFGKQAVRYSA